MKEEIIKYLKSKGFHCTDGIWYIHNNNFLEIFVGEKICKIYFSDWCVDKLYFHEFIDEFEKILIEFPNYE